MAHIATNYAKLRRAPERHTFKRSKSKLERTATTNGNSVDATGNAVSCNPTNARQQVATYCQTNQTEQIGCHGETLNIANIS